MKKILITSKELKDRNWQAIEKLLGEKGVTPIFNEKPEAMKAEEICAVCAREKIEGIIVFSSSDEITEAVFARCRDLKVVSRHGVGVENIDLAAAETYGVQVRTTNNLTDYETVADLTIGLILSTARNIPQVDSSLKQQCWNRAVGHDVWGKTLGIVGLGRIGRAVARRGQGFAMKVLAYDPYVSDAGDKNIEVVDFPRLLAESDFITLHMPLTNETENMFSRREFAAMKKSSYLVNTARAGLVDQDALACALQSGEIAGAGIDVFRTEPPVDDPLLMACPDRIVFTPHIGVYTIEHLMNMDYCVVSNAIEAL